MPKATRASSRVRGRRSAKTPDPTADRLKRLRARLVQDDLPAILVTNPTDIRYLTPFSGEDSFALVTDRSLVIISDSRFAEELKSIEPWATVVMRKGPIAPKAGEVIRDQKLNRVALQAEYVTVAGRKALAKGAGGKRLVDTTGIFNDLRIIKDAVELKYLSKAIKAQQAGLDALLGSLRIGQNELEIAARLEYEMRLAGADGPAFDVNVSIGSNGAKPHHFPSTKGKLRKNSSLLIDWGARVNGYRSDMTRTWGIGATPRKIVEIYQIVLEAQLAAIALMKPGARCKEVDSAARKIIVKAGYGENYGHGLGHGIGLDIHENPRMSPLSKPSEILESGMVVTVEPGIYLSGVGGVRIEDDVLITERGHRVLSNWPKTVESAFLCPR